MRTARPAVVGWVRGPDAGAQEQVTAARLERASLGPGLTSWPADRNARSRRG